MAATDNPLAGLMQSGKLVELKQRLLFVVVALLIYRLGTFVPVPGVNPAEMARLMKEQSGTIVELFNMFSGGALGRMSIFALNVVPYISASIIVQLLGTVVPSLQALRKEGESGRRKLNQWTRYGTVGLAAVQAFSVAMMLQQSGTGGAAVVAHTGPGFVVTAVVSLTAGTMFLMWLGEQITERGVGNGISLLIFAGIVAGLPAAVASTLAAVSDGSMSPLTLFGIVAIVVAVTAFVVFVERAQRRITVNYARRMTQGGRGFANPNSHLPLKLNMSGVIPAVFASSLIMFPATAATWFAEAGQVLWLEKIKEVLSPGQPIHMIIFGTLIVLFAFFYTAMVFNSQETAENLKKSGALIPGIRPGKATADYIDGVLTRLTAWGAAYLVLVCLLPEWLQSQFKVQFYFGGTSLLIVVVVVMDFIAQIQAHLMSHQYDSLLKKANLKGFGRPGSVR